MMHAATHKHSKICYAGS